MHCLYYAFLIISIVSITKYSPDFIDYCLIIKFYFILYNYKNCINHKNRVTPLFWNKIYFFFKWFKLLSLQLERYIVFPFNFYILLSIMSIDFSVHSLLDKFIVCISLLLSKSVSNLSNPISVILFLTNLRISIYEVDDWISLISSYISESLKSTLNC